MSRDRNKCEFTEIERMAYEMERLFIEAETRQTIPKKHPSIVKAEALYNAGYRKQSEGAWQEENTRPKSEQFVCSVCSGLAYFPQGNNSKTWQKHCPYKFCPNCGARMVGGTTRVFTRTEIAREIFAEIEDYMLGVQVDGFPALVINPGKYAELKKKYKENENG